MGEAHVVSGCNSLRMQGCCTHPSCSHQGLRPPSQSSLRHRSRHTLHLRAVPYQRPPSKGHRSGLCRRYESIGRLSARYGRHPGRAWSASVHTCARTFSAVFGAPGQNVHGELYPNCMEAHGKRDLSCVKCETHVRATSCLPAGLAQESTASTCLAT